MFKIIKILKRMQIMFSHFDTLFEHVFCMLSGSGGGKHKSLNLSSSLGLVKKIEQKKKIKRGKF
jgi:hypothetical protein